MTRWYVYALKDPRTGVRRSHRPRPQAGASLVAMPRLPTSGFLTASRVSPVARTDEPRGRTPVASCDSRVPGSGWPVIDNAVEEDVLRALFLQHARAEGIDGDALLEAASARLRAEGLIQ